MRKFLSNLAHVAEPHLPSAIQFALYIVATLVCVLTAFELLELESFIAHLAFAFLLIIAAVCAFAAGLTLADDDWSTW